MPKIIVVIIKNTTIVCYSSSVVALFGIIFTGRDKIKTDIGKNKVFPLQSINLALNFALFSSKESHGVEEAHGCKETPPGVMTPILNLTIC